MRTSSQAGLVEDVSDVARIAAQVATVESDRGQYVAEPVARGVRDGDRGVDGDARVVGIQQQRVAIVGIGDRLEGFVLGVEQLDERVRHGAGRRQSEAKGCAEKRGAEAAADARRAGRDERVLGAPQRELGHRAAAGGPDDAAGLGRDQRGQIDRLQQAALEQQRLVEGSGDAQQRLVGEGDRAFGHGQDLAAEAQIVAGVRERPGRSRGSAGGRRCLRRRSESCARTRAPSRGRRPAGTCRRTGRGGRTGRRSSAPSGRRARRRTRNRGGRGRSAGPGGRACTSGPSSWAGWYRSELRGACAVEMVRAGTLAAYTAGEP